MSGFRVFGVLGFWGEGLGIGALGFTASSEPYHLLSTFG